LRDLKTTETVPTVGSDARVSVAALAYLGSYLLLFVLGAVAIAWVAIGHVNPSTNDTAAGVILGGALVWVVTTIGLYLRYYRILLGAALTVPAGASRDEVPPVVISTAALEGEEFVGKARVKTLLGRAGRCRIEVYANGIRIWRGPSHPEPSWSFLYIDIVQAEVVTLLGGARTPDQSYLRLVAARPRMAFIISSRRWTADVIRRLAGHGVPTFG
jgi:hypothetical protein